MDSFEFVQIPVALLLGFGNRPEVLVKTVEAADLPHLEGLVLQHLKTMSDPPTPVMAVSAPPGFSLSSR